MPLADLDVVLDMGLPANRVVVGGLDRADAVAVGAPLAVAERGAYVAIDHVGTEDAAHVTNKERVAVVTELIAAGHADRILLSSNATGASFGAVGNATPFSHVLTTFVPALRAEGVSEDDVQRILVANPRALLTVKES